MILNQRNLVTLNDLSNGEIKAIFSLTDEIVESVDKQSAVCQGKIMASLFFEPSTRTRLSFETAMHRLGGSVISAVDIGATSLAKGESLADMAKIIGSYADIIVIRHPWEGAAKVVADYSGVPVINAGDGGHEHPTQTLCDLYTLKKERKTIKGLKIALWGDLKYGRTVHSLAYGLARFGATILFRPGPGLEMPDFMIRKLTEECGGELIKSEALDQAIKDGQFPLNAVYITPDSPHQLAMIPDVSLDVELSSGVDAIYVTRLQKERLPSQDEEEEPWNNYPVIDKKLLGKKVFKQTLVMHPLPRVDELAREIDADPRSLYFKQAELGVPVRMALIALLLGQKETLILEEDDIAPKKDYSVYRRESDLHCGNLKCVSVQDTETKYVKPEFQIINDRPLTLRCIYCEHEMNPPYIASSDWHEGRLDNKKYHSAGSHWTKSIKPENLIIFNSKSEAEAQGFHPSRYTEQPEKEND